MNIWSSELAKLAANCMLAQRISSINSLSALCEATGADINELSHAVGLDNRIGPKFLKSSIGFGGSCFKKDVLNLVYMAETLYLPEVADYWRRVVDINEWQKDRFSKRVIRALNSTVEGKRIAVLGLAYKKNTADIRESPALSFIGQMILERALVAIYDPKVNYEHVTRELSAQYGCDLVEKHVIHCPDVYSACEHASALVILTEWDQFSTFTLPSPPLNNRLPVFAKASPNTTRSVSPDSTSSHHSECLSSCDEDNHIHPGTPPTAPSTPALEAEDNDHKADARSNQVLDWTRIATLVRRPRLVFDGRNVIEAAKLRPLGFHVHSIGRRL